MELKSVVMQIMKLGLGWTRKYLRHQQMQLQPEYVLAKAVGLTKVLEVDVVCAVGATRMPLVVGGAVAAVVAVGLLILTTAIGEVDLVAALGVVHLPAGWLGKIMRDAVRLLLIIIAIVIFPTMEKVVVGIFVPNG